MSVISITRCLVSTLLALMLAMPLLAHATAERCSAPWPSIEPVFEAPIRYGDPVHKTDPFITVHVNGRLVRMLLDTGSNRHVIWDARLLSGEVDTRADDVVLNAIASSTPARHRRLAMSDPEGRHVAQAFYVIDETPLMAAGFSGIVSPQYLADDKVSVLNFKDDCFFVSERFDPAADERFRIVDGTALPNVHGVMAVAVGFNGARIPVVVDSGAGASTLPAALLQGAALGPPSRRTVDLLGQSIRGETHMRLVDLTINGQRIARHPVTPQASARDGGIASLGAVGMDVLRDRIVFHDNERHRFAWLERTDVPSRRRLPRGT